nr:immunoglobulin heavy chain junction region [Macaca mulatta]
CATYHGSSLLLW